MGGFMMEKEVHLCKALKWVRVEGVRYSKNGPRQY